MVVSMTQLGTYDQVKTTLVPVMGDNTATHLLSAVTAAIVYSFASLPLVSQARVNLDAPLRAKRFVSRLVGCGLV